MQNLSHVSAILQDFTMNKKQMIFNFPSREPLMQNIYFFGSSYIIPNVDTIVCGGTAQADWNKAVSETDTKKIMDDIFEYFPEMKSSEVVS